ncbi:MAG: hypothetical protein J0H98_08590 [Solirubrobacterales bacterium]|nr:hypothetical protein [Solirubrobacterales bacterium]
MRKKQRNRRVTPALVVSIVALIAAVSGTAVAAQINGSQLAPKSVGGGKLKPFTGGLIKPQTIHGSKLKQFTGGLIKPRTVPGAKIVPDSIGGDQVDESKLGPVPVADRLSGGFSAKLAFGETAELTASGPFKLTAQCVQNGTTADGTEGRDFVRLLIASSEAGSVFTSGVGGLTGNAADQFLGPDTAEADRIVDEIYVISGNSNFKTGGHFNAMAASGAGLSATQGSISAGINQFGTGCAVQGTAVANG